MTVIDYMMQDEASVFKEAATEPARAIMVLLESGRFPISLHIALEREFPDVRVVQAETLDLALSYCDYPVGLVLVEPAFLQTIEKFADTFTSRHPYAIFAEIISGAEASAHASNRGKLVRSALPMDLRLDRWLSVVQLMLCGGEYFPPALLARPQPVPSVESLTSREAEVLELVSRGYSNKVIAAQLGVSEHTVKIHLHNIITKLGASNRTEAALRWREPGASALYGASDQENSR